MNTELNIPIVKKSREDKVVLTVSKFNMWVELFSLLLFSIFIPFVLKQVVFLILLYIGVLINGIVWLIKYKKIFDELIITKDKLILRFGEEKHEVLWDYVTLEWTKQKDAYYHEGVSSKVENLKIMIPYKNRLVSYIVNPWDNEFTTLLYYIQVNKHKVLGVYEGEL